MTTFLYIMQTDSYFKVGITSTSIFKRMKQIQTGCPTPIRNIHYYNYNTKRDAIDAEKLLHNSFARHNTFGEWFKEFPRYISISQQMLNINFEKIELDVNRSLKDYNMMFIRKIKKTQTIDELELVREYLFCINDSYFIEGAKEILFAMIDEKMVKKFGVKLIQQNIDKEAIIIKKDDTISDNVEYQQIVYSDLQKIIKKAKRNRNKMLNCIGGKR